MVVRLALYCGPVWDLSCFLKYGLSGVFGHLRWEPCDIHGCCRKVSCDYPLKGIKVGTVRMPDVLDWSQYFLKLCELCLVYILRNSGEQLSAYLHQGWIGFWLDMQTLLQKGPALILCDVDLRWWTLGLFQSSFSQSLDWSFQIFTVRL